MTKRNLRPILLCLLIFAVFALFAGTALAQTSPACPPGKLCNPIKYRSLDDFLLAIVNVVIQYGALLIVLFLVYAGFQFVTAQGNTEKIQTAKKMFVWIVVGAFVLLGVYVIRAAICGTLNEIRDPSTPPLCNAATGDQNGALIPPGQTGAIVKPGS